MDSIPQPSPQNLSGNYVGDHDRKGFVNFLNILKCQIETIALIRGTKAHKGVGIHFPFWMGFLARHILEAFTLEAIDNTRRSTQFVSVFPPDVWSKCNLKSEVEGSTVTHDKTDLIFSLYGSRINTKSALLGVMGVSFSQTSKHQHQGQKLIDQWARSKASHRITTNSMG